MRSSSLPTPLALRIRVEPDANAPALDDVVAPACAIATSIARKSALVDVGVMEARNISRKS